MKWNQYLFSKFKIKNSYILKTYPLLTLYKYSVSTNGDNLCEFRILKKSLNLPHENIYGQLTWWASNLDQYSWLSAKPKNGHLCPKISLTPTNMSIIVNRPWVSTKSLLWH